MFVASANRYDTMKYNRCGRSGLKLPAISLGWWYNFGGLDVLENGRAIARSAFDHGITHFDLANNYGPPPGSAEETFGRLLREDFAPYRDELIISTKAGYDMWPGPYGEWGSRKYLLASLDQSLKRMGLEYVDIFYSHRPDPETPAGRDHGRACQRRAPGQGALCGHFELFTGTDPPGCQDPARSGHALPDPPAQVQYARPLGRRWLAGYARK